MEKCYKNQLIMCGKIDDIIYFLKESQKKYTYVYELIKEMQQKKSQKYTLTNINLNFSFFENYF
ncbi:MAG: hypothetical protein N2448_05185 [Caloramator sp.]|nr:hypothetical protein [Caloramator sp.]